MNYINTIHINYLNITTMITKIRMTIKIMIYNDNDDDNSDNNNSKYLFFV